MDDDILIALFKKNPQFSNVLSWVGYLALNPKLNYLMQTGETFKNFLQRILTRLSLIGKKIAFLGQNGDNV